MTIEVVRTDETIAILKFSHLMERKTTSVTIKAYIAPKTAGFGHCEHTLLNVTEN